MTRTKFVKRYPRAVIRKRAHMLKMYILDTPGQTPHAGNRVDASWPNRSHDFHTAAAVKVAQHRSEPS